MGNLPVVIIPAICNQRVTPFGTRDACHARALSYSFFSLAVTMTFSFFSLDLLKPSQLVYYYFMLSCRVLTVVAWWCFRMDLHLPTDSTKFYEI